MEYTEWTLQFPIQVVGVKILALFANMFFHVLFSNLCITMHILVVHNFCLVCAICIAVGSKN